MYSSYRVTVNQYKNKKYNTRVFEFIEVLQTQPLSPEGTRQSELKIVVLSTRGEPEKRSRGVLNNDGHNNVAAETVKVRPGFERENPTPKILSPGRRGRIFGGRRRAVIK
jgi:hypothetical protein